MRGDLAEREAAEELEVDDARQPRRRRPRSSSSASLSRLRSSASRHGFGHVGRDRRDLELAAALLRLPAARVVDDQPAHHARGVAHEALAIGKCRALAAGDVQIGLVQQRGRAERHARRRAWRARGGPCGAARRTASRTACRRPRDPLVRPRRRVSRAQCPRQSGRRMAPAKGYYEKATRSRKRGVVFRRPFSIFRVRRERAAGWKSR